MFRRFLIASAALILTRCGVPEYFDQHPANVRPESEAVAAALHQREYGQAIASGTASASRQVRAASIPGNRLPEASPVPPAVESPAEGGSSAPEKSVQISGSPALPASAPGRSTVEISSVLQRSAAIPARTNAVPPIEGPMSGSPAPVRVRSPSKRSSPTPQTLPSPEIPASQAEINHTEAPKGVATGSDQPSISQTLPDAANLSAGSSAPAPSKDATSAPQIPDSYAERSPSAEPVRPAPPANSSPSAHCQFVARTRAEDAAGSGQDSETQRMVREGTYANCVAWEAAHRWHD